MNQALQGNLQGKLNPKSLVCFITRFLKYNLFVVIGQYV